MKGCDMWKATRRDFLKATAASVAGFALGARGSQAQIPGDRPRQDRSVKMLNPMTRVPVSFIIDDSTCLVNLNRERRNCRSFPRSPRPPVIDYTVIGEKRT